MRFGTIWLHQASDLTTLNRILHTSHSLHTIPFLFFLSPEEHLITIITITIISLMLSSCELCAFVDCCLWCSLIWSCCSSVISCCNPDVRTRMYKPGCSNPDVLSIIVTVHPLYTVLLLKYYCWSTITTSTSWVTTTTVVVLGVCC